MLARTEKSACVESVIVATEAGGETERRDVEEGTLEMYRASWAAWRLAVNDLPEGSEAKFRSITWIESVSINEETLEVTSTKKTAYVLCTAPSLVT